MNSHHKKFLSIYCKITAFVLVSFLCLSCSPAVVVHHEAGAERYDSKLPYENGFIFEEDQKFKILLSFHEPGGFITTAHGIRLHLYITGTMKDSQRGLIDEDALVIFFIRVQRYPCYGFIESKNFAIYDFSSDSKHVSGEFVCNDPQEGKLWGNYPPFKHCDKFRFTIQNLRVSEVKDIEALYQYDNEYYRSLLSEKFGDHW